MLIAFYLRYLHLLQFLFTFLTKSLPALCIQVSKRISTQFLYVNVFLHLKASGFRLLYCTLEVNACKSQVYKRCLRINLSLQLTFHKLHLSFLLLVSCLCSTECHLPEMKSSDNHFP